MKKIIVLSLAVLLSYGANAFAAAGALAAHTVSDEGTGIYGGADSTVAGAATNALVRFSKGVAGLVNPTVSGTSATEYVIAAKHTSGSKITATSFDSTKMYWKSVPVGVFSNGDISSDATAAMAFQGGTGFTEY